MFVITKYLFLSLLMISELNCLNQYENLNSYDWLKKILKPQSQVTAKLFVLNKLNNGKGFYITLDDEISLNTDNEKSEDVIENTIDKSIFFRKKDELFEIESESDENVKNSARIQSSVQNKSSGFTLVPRGSRGKEKCVRACKEVVWSVCHYFSCDRRTRRRIRRRCRRACRKRF